MGEMTTVGDLPAYRAVPAGEGPWPGLVLVHEIFGLDDEMRRHADRLAAMGYLVLAPDLLARGRRLGVPGADHDGAAHAGGDRRSTTSRRPGRRCSPTRRATVRWG